MAPRKINARRRQPGPFAVSPWLRDCRLSGLALPSAQCAEARADLFGEELRLFPGGEVAALVDLVVVDEVGVGPFGPAARRLILLVGEDARGHRDGHALGVEEATLIFPVQTRRGDPGVRQPVERDVVEDLLTR